MRSIIIKSTLFEPTMLKKTLFKATMLCALSLFNSAVAADIRVLIEYDQHSHRLLQMVALNTENAAPVSDHLREGNERKKVLADVLRGNNFKVGVLWTASDGSLLEKDFINDPRSTHAPISPEQPRPTVIGLEKGAYMLDGPEGSAFVEIQLPAHAGLGLGAQSWRFALTP